MGIQILILSELIKLGQDVKQIWTLYVDLGRFFPARLVEIVPQFRKPCSSFCIYLLSWNCCDGKEVPGLSLDDPDVGQLAFPVYKIAPSFPTFVTEQSVPVNVQDNDKSGS